MAFQHLKTVFYLVFLQKSSKIEEAQNNFQYSSKSVNFEIVFFHYFGDKFGVSSFKLARKKIEQGKN